MSTNEIGPAEFEELASARSELKRLRRLIEAKDKALRVFAKKELRRRGRKAKGATS